MEFQAPEPWEVGYITDGKFGYADFFLTFFRFNLYHMKYAESPPGFL